MKFGADEFDLVSELGVLHHIRRPQRAVAGMFRVVRWAVLFSDSNNFGQGLLASRTVKQLINMFGLWQITDYVKTCGKGYTSTEGDGLIYSYSVFNN